MSISPEHKQAIVQGVRSHLDQRGHKVSEVQVASVVEELAIGAHVIMHIDSLAIKELIRPDNPSNGIDNTTSHENSTNYSEK